MSDSPKYYSINEYANLPQPEGMWLVENLIPIGGLTILYGEPKSRKSYLSLGGAINIASNAPYWLGERILKPGPVLYVQLDTPRPSWNFRMNLLKKAGIRLEDAPNLFLADRMSAPGTFNILEPPTQHWMRECLSETKAKLVILDTVRKIHQLGEDKSEDSEKVLNAVRHACGEASILLVTHGKKPKGDGADYSVMAGTRGSGNYAGSADVIFQLRRTGETGTLLYEGRATEDGKMRLQAEPFPSLLWRLHPDDEFKKLTHHVYTDIEGTPGIKAKELAKLTGKSEETCKKAIQRHGEAQKLSPTHSGTGF